MKSGSARTIVRNHGGGRRPRFLPAAHERCRPRRTERRSPVDTEGGFFV